MPATPRDQSADVRARDEIARLGSGRHVATQSLGIRLDDVLQMIEAHQALKGRGQGGNRRLYAINRAALITLTGHFQGFVVDLFTEVWQSRYASDPERLLRTFNNPWPDDIDSLFGLLALVKLTRTIEPRATATTISKDNLNLLAIPRAGRANRTDYQVRTVVGELVAIRNRSSHGGRLNLRLRDVTNYLIDVVALALAMDGAV